MSTRPKNFRIDDSHYAVVVRRPVAILMVTLAVGVFGWVSYKRLALTLMPDMSYPTLTVRTSYPGTAPEEMETVVSRPLEQQLGIIPKLVSISSVSKASQSDVILEFQWKTDMDLIAQEVREKVDRIRFPEGAQRPLLLHYDPSLDPILRIGLAGPQSLYELRYLAENDVKRKLEAISGVAAVQVKGGLEEQFLVAIDENKLSNLRLDISQIATRLQQGNVNMPGGNLREGQTEYLIRTLNEFRTLEEIGSVIISRQNGVDIRLRDIATVSRFHEDRQVITRVNGNESVEIEIFKEADANVLVVAAAVKATLFGRADQQTYVADQKKPAPAPTPAPAQGKDAKGKQKQAPAPSAASQLAARSTAMALMNHRQMTDFIAYSLPTGATVQILSDQSVFIDNSIREVKENAIFGGLIAIAVLYLFLRNIPQTLIVSLCIPISILATFAPMYMAGVSLNIISLGGLALGVGNLVDNAIVVLESIFRCRQEGDEPLPSVVRGTSEVAMPVVASTLTTVAVFFPIVFVEGVAGQMFGDMALAVVFSQIASLIAALYLIPMLAALMARLGTGEFATETNAAPSWRTNDYLVFPILGAKGGRLALAGRTLGLVLQRIGWGLALLLAVVLKTGVALICVVLWPLFWPIKRLRSRAATIERWLAADALGPVASSRVWPGMLALPAISTLGASLSKTGRWFGARKWRWIFLLVVPAIAVGVVLATRTTPPPGPPAPPSFIFPGMPAAPDKPWLESVWQWFGAQAWWLLVLLFVPGVVPFVFVLARAIAAIAARFLGSVLQTTLLMIAQAFVGLIRACGTLLAPVTNLALGWFESGNGWLQDNYPRMLTTTLRHRGMVLAGSFLAVLLCVVFVVPRLGRDLIPQVHQGEFNLDLTLPIGTPIERTGEMAAVIDKLVLQQPEVERTALTVGAEEGASTAIEAGEHTARLTVKMKTGLSADDETKLVDRIRSEFSHQPELKMEISYPALFSFKSPIEVEIRGHDLATLKRLSREAEEVLGASVPGLVDIRSSLQSGHPEIQVVYQRDRLAEYGLNLRSVADLVRNKVQGRIATEFRQEDQLIDIVVRLREEDRFGIEELRRLVVNPGGAVPISLAAVADLTVNEGPSEIRRVDQQRTALITANIKGADLATVSHDIVNAMETIPYPPGFSYTLAGQNQEMRTSLNSLLVAFALAVFLVYIVMASQFESLVQPLLIMMTVPLAMIGVVLVLWLAAIPVTIMVFLGLIILVGIVVNNAIVLIDYINTLRSRGVEKREAIIEAGRARLRPIIMTALTTIVGLVPMALGIGEGAEIRAPMAITVIVGLSAATLLTLVVIPTLYYQFTSSRPMTLPDNTDASPAAGEPAPGLVAK
ncbi:MAG TPA: efflux RND transporter permease subunit [Opitutaceae bacterium]|nr:efflux RND transporter permease subunit [Opitutaceae bacterium]